MKENLKVKINSVEEREEAQNLFHSMGSRIFRGSQFEVVVVYELMKPFKEITLPELRELARPKEYLNDKFELVVTNQPDDGWFLVQEGMDIATKMEDGSVLFWKTVTRLVDSIVWQRTPQQETTMSTKKEGRFLHQEWYEAFGRGEDVQHTPCERDCDWTSTSITSPISIFSAREMKFRLKPKTIQIGSRTINKPISVKPDVGDVVYVSNITAEAKYTSIAWDNSLFHIVWFNRNLCHLTAADAINHTDALLELME